MEMTLIYTVIGFALAGYSVIANDSIQTLGTFIASKKKWFKWYILAGSCLLYTSPSPRDPKTSRMPSSA